MTTTTQAPPVTATADRFRCEADVPDPPRDPAGRKQYWDDTVAEAVAELRRRLASTRDEKSFQALQMIVDLEKTRLRHKEPVAGTHVETRWSSGLGSMEDSTSSGGRVPENEHLTPPATAIRAGSVSDGSSPPPSLTLPAPTPSPSLTLPARTPREEVGPDGLTADLRAWIQEGHDYYDRLEARGNCPQLLPESSPAW